MSVNTEFAQEIRRAYPNGHIPNTPLPMSLMAQEGNGDVTKAVIKTLTILHLNEVISEPQVSIISGEMFSLYFPEVDDTISLYVYAEDDGVSCSLNRETYTSIKNIARKFIPMPETYDFADKLYTFIEETAKSIKEN